MSTTTLSPSALYCAYLRKSRKDAELEALGQGETLARHAKALTDLAARLGIAIAHTYRELVSGDTIAERPQMRKLLEAVNAGAWAGVLVMDADRLGRGDSIDQGVIMQSFMYSGTLIITPDKIYDPSDDSDSEFFEIKLFFARREYNMIKKRMQRGRLASAMAGSWQSPRAPYGYARCQLPSRKWSLAPVPEKAEIVRSVFRWYAEEDIGASTIARRLNGMGLATESGGRWTASSVAGMLTNPVYIGMVQWNKRVSTVRIEDGRRVKSRPLSENPILSKGLHEGIVDPALFERVQQMFAGHAKRPNNVGKPTTNPLSGLVLCGQCGRHMQAKGCPDRRGDFLYCQTQDCPTCSTYIFVVENAVLEALGEWLRDYGGADPGDVPTPSPDDPAAQVRAAARVQLKEQLRTLEGQSDRLYDLLEQGVYTIHVFRKRREELDQRIEETRAALSALDAAPRPDPRRALVPQLRTVLDGYHSAPSPAEKNRLLRTVIDRVVYHKTQRCYRNNKLTDHLSLEVFPRMPDDDF